MSTGCSSHASRTSTCTLERDCALLRSAGYDLVVAERVADVREPQDVSAVPLATFTDLVNGAFRPQFLPGVCTVVLKLFNIVQPTVAVCGKKARQQLMTVAQLALPIEIVGGVTVRDVDGLALAPSGQVGLPLHLFPLFRGCVLWEHAGDPEELQDREIASISEMSRPVDRRRRTYR